jgi:hypothetical protein
MIHGRIDLSRSRSTADVRRPTALLDALELIDISNNIGDSPSR